MNIIFVASEVAPYAKTGGLADVAGSLPKFLAQLGHNVAVFMPLYRQVKQSKQEFTDTGETFSVVIGDKLIDGKIFAGKMPKSKVPIYFIANDDYFDRPELYMDRAKNADYDDNSERFIFFARGVLEAAEILGLKPDVVHCNDWQSALIPAYIKTIYGEGRAVSDAKTLLTIHNMGYQGLFWHWDMKLTGLSWTLFNWQQLEFYGRLNFLKAGIVFADQVNTVSRRYAEEIQADEFGHGLAGALRERSDSLFGVVNGIDYTDWSPEVDELIPAKYSMKDMTGKATCKEHLLKLHNLPKKKRTPLIGMISRLDKQKGFDILELALPRLMEMDLQMVILGTGDKKYHDLFEAAAKRYPEKLAINLAFNNQLAHQIEAGSDMFMMPSRYEPCGLNQLYSLKYGTVPVVRATGGLADTIVDCTDETLASGQATGFSFEQYTPVDLLETVERALKFWRREEAWDKLVHNGMRQDWSWSRSAKEYVALYKRALGTT